VVNGSSATSVITANSGEFCLSAYRIKQTFGMPTFAYHVSGEYAQIKAASQNGWIDE